MPEILRGGAAPSNCWAAKAIRGRQLDGPADLAAGERRLSCALIEHCAHRDCGCRSRIELQRSHEITFRLIVAVDGKERQGPGLQCLDRVGLDLECLAEVLDR
jgi:hypothetical protein